MPSKQTTAACMPCVIITKDHSIVLASLGFLEMASVALVTIKQFAPFLLLDIFCNKYDAELQLIPEHYLKI